MAVKACLPLVRVVAHKPLHLFPGVVVIARLSPIEEKRHGAPAVWLNAKRTYPICPIYRMNQVKTETADEVSHSKQYFEDLILMLIVFGLVYFIVRFTRIYRLKTVNLIIIAALPAALFITRISGEKSGGAYISFFGILIFAVVLVGYPFAAAYFLSREENRYLHGGVRSMPLNLALFLGYTFILYIGCVNMQ